MPSSLESLYRQIKGFNSVGNTYGEFQKQMADAGYRKGLYNALSKSGANVGKDLGEFESKLGYGYVATPKQEKGPSETPQRPSQSDYSRVSGFDKTVENIQKYQQERGKQPVQIGVGGNVVKTDNGYLTVGGHEYDNPTFATQSQMAYDDAARRELHPVETDLRDAYAEKDRLNKEMEKIQGKWVDADGNVHYGNRGNDESVQYLKSAMRQNEKRITAIEAERADKGQTQFWQGFMDTAKDPSTWSFGLTDLEDAAALSRIKSKMDSGKELSDAEKTLLQQTYMNNTAQSKYGSNRGALYRFGGISMQALPFIGEFMLTGGYSALTKAGAKGGTALASKLGAKGIGKTVMKNLGIAAGDVAAGAAMANTTGVMRTFSDVMGRHTGNVTMDEKGDYKFEGGKSLGRSIYEAEVANTLEYYTEKLGEHMKLGKGLAEVADRYGLKKLSKAINYASSNKWLERGGVQDYPSEVIEEEANLVLNSILVGDNSLSDLDPRSQTQMDIWGGMAFSIGLMQSPRFINSGRKYAGYKLYENATNTASKNAEDVFSPDKWEVLKEKIDSTDNQNISDVLSSVVTSDMSQQQKEATMYYADSLLKMRGYNTALMNDIKANGDNAAQRGMDESYMMGYNAQSPEQMEKIESDAATAAASLQEFGPGFATWVMDPDNNPQDVLNTMTNNPNRYTDRQIKAAMDFYTADSARRGMEDAGAASSEAQKPSSDARISYITSEQNASGKHVVNSFDKDGNLIGSEEFDEKDDADAYMGRLKMEQQMRSLNDYLNTEEARRSQDAIMAFEEENGWEPGTIAELAASDPYRMSDAEWMMADKASEFLKGLAYPSDEVHVNTSRQDGVETADKVIDKVISPTEPINPQDNEGKAIVEQWGAAQQARNEAFGRNEDLMQEVTNMEQAGLMPQEILSSLDTFSPQDRQIITDYYNARAQFEGYMSRAQQKIDGVAAENRKKNTFKGTINGQPAGDSLIYITDGQNQYTLIGGNISTNSQGQVTGSDSGLIIVLDQNGDYISLPDDATLSVISSGITMDQYEESERQRLQQEVTLVSDPNGAMMQQEEQGGNLENVGGEASAGMGTGADNPPTAAPSEQQINIPVDEKTGVKLYEQGVPIDQTIDDLKKDGHDIVGWSDLAIGEAQGELNKMKQPKTRAELIRNEARVKELQGIIDYYNKVKGRWEEMNRPATPANSEENVNVQPEQNKVAEKAVNSQQNPTVEEQKQQRIAEAKAKYGELFDDDFTKANDVYELVSMWVGRKRNLAWDDVNGKRGLQKELGWTRKIGGDTKYIETLLAKNGEGMGVDEFAHMVWESPENSIGEEKRWSTEEIKDAMLELLKSAQSKSDVVDYALNTRIAQAETTLQEQQRAKEEEAEQKEVIEPLTDEELRAIESNLPFAAPSEGEDISESPITQLISVIAELQQQEGMPEIKLVDTGRMSDDKWYDITSQMYDGAFVSQEDVDDVRDYILEQGVFYNPGIGITVYSDGQTAEEVKYKVETINSIINGKEDGELEAEVVQRHEGRSDAEEAAEAGEEIGKKSESQPADDYLTPRNEEEKAIIQGVIDDLQKDIQGAVDERSKARAELEKARVKESDRATDMFANDDSFAEPDAIFSQEEMGFDTSVEGVERRTSAQQEKLQEATNKLNQLQSPEERDSRIRGALDNYRRQTSIGFEEETPSVPSDIKTPSQQKAYLEAKQEIFDHNMTEEQIVKESDELAGRIQEFENDRTGFRDRLIARKRAFDDALERIRIKNKERQKEVEEQSPFKVGEEVEMKHTNKKMKVVSINRDGTLNLVNDTLTTTPIREDNVDPSKIKKKQKEQPKQEYAPTWQYNFHYDKNTKHVRIDREDVSGPIPIGDGRWHLDANSLAEMRGILENPKNNLAEVYKEVEASLHNAEVGEQLRNESDPVEAIEQAAKSFKQEQEKKAYGAENKLVSQDRYEELKKRMKAKLLGQLNAGVDPEIMAIGAEMAMYHIEAGARKFSDYATRMISDLGDSIRPYLKAFYESARRMPGMEELSRGMDATDVVDNFDILNYDKQPATTVNEHKQEDNDTENVVSSQQESVPEEQQEARLRFVSSVRRALLLGLQKGEKPFRNINDLRNLARNEGMEVDADGRDDILLQELVEDAIVGAARDVVEPELGEPLDRSDYDLIVKLYEMQPTIGARSSNRIKMQQYSTPLPMSYVADMMVEGALKVLEPTAGNGMMVIALPADTVFVNELDQTRLDNLRRQGFAEVTNQDATEPFSGGLYDAIVANPPFGSAEAKDYDGKMITGLAEQIALNALSKMKDDGKAVIIIGGKTEYAANGSIKNNKPFFTYLYDHYNVKGVIEMDGKLYAKQGTTYPTRMIVIDGRRSEEERAQSKVYPPTIAKAVGMKANTFEELYDIAERIKNEKSKTNGNEVLRTSTGIALPDNNDAPGNTDRSGRDGQSGKNEPNGERTEPRGSNQGSKETSNKTTARNSGRSTMGVQQPGIPGLFDSQEAASEPQPQSGGSRERGSLVNNGRNGSADVQGSGTADSGVGLNTPQNPKETPKSNIEQAPAEPVKPKVDEKRELTTDKLSYRPHNTAYSLESVAPAAMVEAMDNMLSKIEKEHGNIDTFVTRELGYDSIEEMHNALAAEQVDSVAMAIYQMKQGQGMIIGDQTGVGKGRQMAALIRWACRQGKKPVFITQKADLFSDIYRDLVDIGSGELRPFIFNSDGAMVDNNGVVVHKPLPAKAQASVFAGSKLPAGYDFTVLTYSQVNTGDKISRDETKQAAKEKNERYQERKRKGGERATPKATFLRALAKDNYMFLDESHTAAGKSNTGAYFQSILKDAEAVTFASATFAKRPDTMPMYALRTAMSKAKVKTDELIDIIANGGVTLQEIMSRALTQAGQMVRRERDMSDVVTDWKTVDDPETVKKARQNYDSTIEAFNAIIDFQKNWVVGYLDRLSHDLADVASSAGMRQGTEDLGISNVPFASKTYNYTKQLMLALKVDAIVDEVVKEIEAGRHPVIALENTMGSLLSEYSPGDVIEDTTFAASLLKGLKGVLRYTIKDEDGKEIQKELKPSDLGPDGEAAYHDVEDLIKESTAGIFISPLDAITEKLQQKGYKVGELTGRNEMAVLDENTGEYKVQRRTDKDKKKLARDFNSGALDVLILNKSASTGISLHASEKFSDQRQRTMIIAQPLADINDYMQMIGRIDRTGQVARGYYINLGLPVPAEGRFLMMLSTKLKSLNANTTTSQENESNDVEAPDLLNKYGSQVVVEYLRDNPDIYIKMGEPLKHDNSRITASQLDSYVPSEDDARKVTGYVALLPTNEQDAFYNDVVRRYTELIKYLNDTGSNDLKISVLPLRARTIDKQISSEGSDPSGNNPFAGHAYVEWIDMDVLKKPMKAAEINKVIEQLNPEGKESVKKILDTVEKEYQAKMDKEQSRYDTAKAKTDEAIKEQTEKINKSKRTPEQKTEAIEKFKIDKMQSLEETHNNMVNKIDASRGRLEKPIRDFEVGDSYLVPDDLTTETFFGASPAIFCGFKAKDEGITPSTTLAVFCTLDGRRKIEVKLSDWGALARIKNHTEQNWDAAHEVSLDNWDSQIPSESRKHGYIMTGNILQAFADAGDGGRVPGQLVTYTDIDGNVHDGILMNQHWEPSDLKGSSAPLKTRMEEIKNLPNGDHITSEDGNVVIGRSYQIYTLSVPKSKKIGAQYYENVRLLNAVHDSYFYPYRGQLRADIVPENIEEVVNILSDLGVQVKSDTQVKFDTETEMGQAMANGRFNANETDPLKAILQAANSWRRSVKESESSLNSGSKVGSSDRKDVPLTRRTMKSYTDKNGSYHEGIEEEIARIKGEISAAVNKGDSQDVLESKQETSARPRVNDLRKQAAKLRAEIARRNQKKQELRKKYNIDEKGNISLDDLSRMFRDLNSNKAVGKLFDKVVKVLEKLNVSYRLTDNLEAMTAGEAGAFYNATFYNWDVLVRDGKDQTKAGDLLHEMIHNVAEHILMRYENPELTDTFGKLSPELEKAAQEIKAIFKAVRAAKLKKPNGKSYYGSTFASEMIAELADVDFRKALDTVAYNRDKENSHRTAWQAIKEWFRKLFGVNTALDNLGDVLDNILDSYSPANIRIYNQEREIMERRTIDEGRTGDYMDYLEANEISGSASLVEDADIIERLENEPKIKVYRAMQLRDGKLYPPMAAKVNGKWQDPLPIGEWSQADEHPELVNKDGKFDLDKGNGKKVANVVYAPYMHGSTTMLNDQFKEAQDRPELVVVEAEMPESELTSGYQAEKSPRKTGMLDWKAGTIQGQLTGTRQVMLSRWVKPIRIVPSSEVAASIKRMIDGQVDVMPTNVVTPEQREELEKLGVKFVKTNNKEIIQEGEHKGEQYSDVYGKKSKKRKLKSQKTVDGDPLEAISRSAAAWRRKVADDEGMTPEAHSAKALYNDRLNRVETVFTEAYQDALVSLKTAQNAIAGDKEIPDSQNAYQAENLMHGKNKNEQDLYNRMFRDPLINTINRIMNLTGMNWGDIDRYVYTKSGLERNREFFMHDWLEGERKRTIHNYEELSPEGQDIYDKMANTIETMFEDGDIESEVEKNKKLAMALQKAHQLYVDSIDNQWQHLKTVQYQDLKDGLSDYRQYLGSMTDFIQKRIDSDYNPSEHDYSGFRAMYGDENGEYNDEDIINELMDTESGIGDVNTDTIWNQINNATRYGLERYREAGMRSDEQIDRVEQMFNFYVPMRGFKDSTGEDMYQYFTSKGNSKSYVGGLLKQAKGRGSEANYPISTIFAMTYKAIADCNQNLVNQKLYRLCQANPNDLVTLSDSWAVYNDALDIWEETAPEIPEDASEEDVRQITLAWEERMNDLAKEKKAVKIKGSGMLDYKPMDKKKQSEHIVDVRISGQPRKMIVTANPRMAQALNGQLRFERGDNVFSRWNAAIKNFMASVFTSYSPTFALRNMMRDWTHFRTMLGVREGEGYAKQASKYYRQSLFKMVDLFKRYRDGNLNEDNEMERDFKDFMDNGGITGFVFMQKVDDIQKEMEKLYKQQKDGKTIKLNNKLWDYTLGAIEAVNEGIENNARFATYRASRHYANRTKARSAYDAKEITVNFNRKGAGSKTYGYKSQNKRVEDAAKMFGVTSQVLGEGRIFFNATIQAIATTFKNFQNADGSLNKPYIAKWATRYALPPFMFGFLLPYINQALAAALGNGGDDDPYANLPEWTRRKNLCLYIGNDNFITIPVGQELAAFLALGDIAAGMTYAQDLKPVDRRLDEEMVDVMSTFSPVDMGTKVTKGGIIEDPISEVTGRTFSVLAPLVAVEQNLGWTGRPIYREDKFENDPYTPEYQMVYSGTNPVLVNASKLLHELGGGDDITRGKAEVNPAIIQYLWEQYTGGPGKVFSNTISIGKDAKDILSGNESDFNIRKVEGVKAFISQGDDRTQYYRTQAKYRKYSDDAKKLYHDVKGYEKAAAEDPTSLMKLQNITKGEDYVRMQIVREADKSLSKMNKAVNKAEGSEKKRLRRLYNQQIKEVVDLLDSVGKE